jgi:GT2 family glycosyltransferase
MVSDALRFSVIVPTRGRPALAAGCVRAALAQADPPPFELVVADQSDDGATREAVEGVAAGDSRVRVLRVLGRGRSRALNAGIRAAQAAWIVVTDDDCRPAPDWLATLARAVDGVRARGIVVGRVVAGERGPGAGEPPAVLDEVLPFEVRGLALSDWIYPNLAFPREALQAVGGYDERLGIGTPIPGGEDNDWGYRLLRAGWTIAYRPEPVVVHEAWRSIDERLALKRAYGIGQGGFYAKHIVRADAFIAFRLVADLFKQARGAAAAALTGRGRDARGHLAYARGVFSGSALMTGLILRGVPERSLP